MSRSKIVPYIEGEAPSDRHARRLETNLDYEEEVRQFCERNKIEMSIKNDGHHWIFVYKNERGKQRIEWWPSSAKLVINQQWDNERHIHDYKKVLSIIAKYWKLNENP